MKQLLIALSLAATLAGTPGAAAETSATHDLLGEDLSQWILFLPDADANPDDTWSYQDGVVSCTGKPNGYMRTRESYSNYTIHLEWRWTGEPGNSGLLLHVNGKDTVWPQCIESQLMNGNAGDFYFLGGTRAAELESGRRIQKQLKSNEKAPGEWNSMDVTCQDDTITIRVNGELQNKATQCSVSSGTIALQSEGKPIAFRNVTLTPIRK